VRGAGNGILVDTRAGSKETRDEIIPWHNCLAGDDELPGLSDYAIRRSSDERTNRFLRMQLHQVVMTALPNVKRVTHQRLGESGRRRDRTLRQEREVQFDPVTHLFLADSGPLSV